MDYHQTINGGLSYLCGAYSALPVHGVDNALPCVGDFALACVVDYALACVGDFALACVGDFALPCVGDFV